MLITDALNSQQDNLVAKAGPSSLYQPHRSSISSEDTVFELVSEDAKRRKKQH